MNQKIHTSWDASADWYASYLAKPGTFQSDLIFPGTLRLLAPKNGKVYLDISCGEGSFARALAKGSRATSVGFDASPSLIARASTFNIPYSKFFVSDVSHFSRHLAPASIDGAPLVADVDAAANSRSAR